MKLLKQNKDVVFIILLVGVLFLTLFKKKVTLWIYGECATKDKTFAFDEAIIL